MAARPLESVRTAKMMHTCQTNMLVAVSHSSSRQEVRAMPNGTFNTTSPAARTGRPIHIDKARKVSGG